MSTISLLIFILSIYSVLKYRLEKILLFLTATISKVFTSALEYIRNPEHLSMVISISATISVAIIGGAFKLISSFLRNRRIRKTIIQWIGARREYYRDRARMPIYLEPKKLADRFGFELIKVKYILSRLLKEGRIFMDSNGNFWFWSKEENENATP